MGPFRHPALPNIRVTWSGTRKAIAFFPIDVPIVNCFLFFFVSDGAELCLIDLTVWSALAT